jgi:hypothetical protein
MSNRWVLALLVTIISSGIAQRSQGTPQTSSPLYSPGPVTSYSAALPDAKNVLRFRRGERYNIPNPSVAELGEDSDAQLMELPATHFKRESLPTTASDAVVVGSIKAGQAYLSNDKRDIYSEFKVQLIEVLKSPNAPFLNAGDSVDVSRKGGVIRLPSGKILVRGAEADSMPSVGGKYLMFLKYSPEAEDFTMITGFRLDGDRVYYLDDQDFKSSNHRRPEHMLRQVGQDENQFLIGARASAAQKKGEK